MQSLALIGAGYWGKNLARNFYQLGALSLVCDSRDEILNQQKKSCPGIRVSKSIESVLLDPSISRVAIAAPAALHYELTKKALLLGKDVFVEKPLALNVQHGEELRDLAIKKNRILMVGHLLQYHPCYLAVRDLIDNGQLGALQYCASNRLNLGKVRREENALWSFAPHDVSVILALAGNQMPVSVRCSGMSFLNPQVADITITSMRFEGGIGAHIYVSWLNPFKEQKLTIVGSQAMVVFDDTKPWQEKLRIFKQPFVWDKEEVPQPIKSDGELVFVHEKEPLSEECSHFLDCCENRITPRTDANEGLRVLRVLQAAQNSLEKDGDFGSDYCEKPPKSTFSDSF